MSKLCSNAPYNIINVIEIRTQINMKIIGRDCDWWACNERIFYLWVETGYAKRKYLWYSAALVLYENL